MFLLVFCTDIIQPICHRILENMHNSFPTESGLNMSLKFLLQCRVERAHSAGGNKYQVGFNILLNK